MTLATLTPLSSNHYRLMGDIDFDQISAIYEAGIAQFSNVNQTSIEIDLSQLQSSNSAALALFLAWLRYAKRYNIQLHYANMPSGLQQVAQVCGITDLLL